MIEIWKVKVIGGYKKEFENYCNNMNIKYKAYPAIIENKYAVKAEYELLHDIGYCIATIEKTSTLLLS